MAAAKTHFEQIPVEEVKLIAKGLPAKKQDRLVGTVRKTSVKQLQKTSSLLRKKN